MADCKIPEIPFPSGVEQNLQRILSPIKETLDIWAGRIGDPLCRAITVEDLLDEAVTVNIIGSGGSGGTDSNAIHDNVAGEISAIALKSTPVSADLLLIEDSAVSFAKKHITVGSISAGGGTTFMVSANDTTPGYLEDKLIVSHGANSANPLELSTLNDGADEDRQLQFDEAKVDHDQLLNFLAAEHIDWAVTGGEDIHVDRITAAAVTQHVGSINHDSLLNTHNLTTDIDHDQLDNFESGEHTDAMVKISSNDSTPGYLEDKVVVSDGANTTYILELSTLNDGGNEDIQIQIDEAKINHANLLNLTTGDPHTQYQLESEKSAASGYASLDASVLVPTAELGTGSASSANFLRGDQTWAAAAGGDVSKDGTPVDDQVGVWTGDGTIEGTVGLTYDGTALDITGNITLSGTVDGIDIATDVAANTLKDTNADHTGEVTGSGALALDNTSISNRDIVTALGSDYVLIGDSSDSDNLKRALISDFASAGGDMAAATYDPDTIAADCFDMDNMVEGTTTKILTDTERTDIATNTSARHTQGTDTTLGTMTADIDMNSLYQIVNLQAPATIGEAIRQTANITEANLETLTDNSIANTLHRHSELVASDGAPDPAFSIDATGLASFPAGTGINEFSTDGTLAGDSDDAVPTEKAVKTYVDGAAGGDLPNILINQNFSIWQENTTFTNPANGVYTADGYYVNSTAGGGTIPTINVKKNTSAMETGFAQCCEWEITNVGSAGTTRSWSYRQKIEDFEKYRGKTVTFSIRIKASTAIALTVARILMWDGVSASSTTISSVTTSWVTYSTTLTVDINIRPVDETRTWFSCYSFNSKKYR